jgi:hypothetical protein
MRGHLQENEFESPFEEIVEREVRYCHLKLVDGDDLQDPCYGIDPW